MLTDQHNSLDNYHILADKSMESIDDEIRKQITHLHFSGHYGYSLEIRKVDFSSFHLQHVQHIHVMSDSLPACCDVRFTGIHH